MRKLLLMATAVLLWAGMQAQTLPYNDDFESYTVGGFIAAQNSTWWTTWSNLPGSNEDGEISTAFAHSATKSVLIDEVSAASDLILKLGNKTTGSYELSWWMYVETGKCGYHNIQHFESPGTEWALECYFRTDGTGELFAGSATAIPFTYPKATWFQVKHMIDLDADNIKMFVNGTLINEWPFSYQASSTTGTKQLGGVDFFAGAASGTTESPKFFFDDLVYQPAPTVLYSNGFDTYALNSYVAVNDPVWFTTWSNAPGTGEDALVKADFAHSTANSALIDETGGATDLILKLGDKVSGTYELTWWSYIEAAKCGYYNLQHFESPGTEYAMEAYFRADGTGELLAGSATAIPFTYPKAAWFETKHLIDLDADNIKMYINGVLVHEWPFSYQSGSTTGTKQLGGVDFYAGAKSGSGESPKAYMDDVYFAQLGAASDPVIVVDPTSLTSYIEPGTMQTQMLTVSNTGASDLIFAISTIYATDGLKSSAPVKQGSAPVLSFGNAIPTNGGSPSTDATAVLNYDGDNASAIGWGTVPITATVAARFPYAMTGQYAGMMIESVDVFINNLNTTGSNLMTIKIFDMGSTYEPGTLLYSQTFTPAGSAWEHVVLTTPVLITGADIWVGYQFTQSEASIYIPGTDAGPNDPNGDFISTGVGWSHLSNNPALMYNWNIRANLNGNVLPHWLVVSPLSGTVAPAGNMVLDVTFDATDLTAGVYEGIIRILNNDPTNDVLDVPCTLDVSVGINENEMNNVMVYPNPANDVLNVQSNGNIEKITIISYSGNTVYTGTQTRIDVNNLASGVYFVQTITSKGTSNIRFIKK